MLCDWRSHLLPDFPLLREENHLYVRPFFYVCHLGHRKSLVLLTCSELSDYHSEKALLRDEILSIYQEQD